MSRGRRAGGCRCIGSCRRWCLGRRAGGGRRWWDGWCVGTAGGRCRRSAATAFVEGVIVAVEVVNFTKVPVTVVVGIFISVYDPTIVIVRVPLFTQAVTVNVHIAGPVVPVGMIDITVHIELIRDAIVVVVAVVGVGVETPALIEVHDAIAVAVLGDAGLLQPASEIGVGICRHPYAPKGQPAIFYLPDPGIPGIIIQDKIASTLE